MIKISCLFIKYVLNWDYGEEIYFYFTNTYKLLAPVFIFSFIRCKHHEETQIKILSKNIGILYLYSFILLFSLFSNI